MVGTALTRLCPPCNGVAIFGTNLRIEAASVCICAANLRTVERWCRVH